MTLEKNDWVKIEKLFGRYAKIMGEEFRSQIRPIAEMQQEHGKILNEHGEKIDAITEMVAQNTIDITIIKSDIAIIKDDLKQKVDRDEFVALEKRVIFLENKLQKT